MSENTKKSLFSEKSDEAEQAILRGKSADVCLHSLMLN